MRTVSAGIMNIRKTAKAVCWLIPQHEDLRSLPVDYAHVMVEGKIIKTGGAEDIRIKVNESGLRATRQRTG